MCANPMHSYTHKWKSVRSCLVSCHKIISTIGTSQIGVRSEHFLDRELSQYQ